MGYELSETQHSGYTRSEVTKTGLDAIKIHVDQPSEQQNAMLTAAGYKNGAWLETWADSWDDLYDFVEELNDMGVNCAVNTEELDGIRRPYPDDEVYTQIVISQKPYNEAFYNDLEGNDDVGRFLGYPEAERAAFDEYGTGVDGYTQDEDGNRHWMFDTTVEDEADHVYPPEALANKYDRSADEHEALDHIYYLLRDEPDALEEAIERGRTRKKALDAMSKVYNVSFMGQNE